LNSSAILQEERIRVREIEAVRRFKQSAKQSKGKTRCEKLEVKKPDVKSILLPEVKDSC
jgi:hypothetical protein